MGKTAENDVRSVAGSRWGEHCCPALAETLDRDHAERLASTLKAIADPARLQILSLLRSRTEGEACACDFVAPLGLAQPTVSHHLKVLGEAGLLEREQRGRWAYFRLVPERLEVVRRALAPAGRPEPALS